MPLPIPNATIEIHCTRSYPTPLHWRLPTAGRKPWPNSVESHTECVPTCQNVDAVGGCPQRSDRCKCQAFTVPPHGAARGAKWRRHEVNQLRKRRARTRTARRLRNGQQDNVIQAPPGQVVRSSLRRMRWTCKAGHPPPAKLYISNQGREHTPRPSAPRDLHARHRRGSNPKAARSEFTFAADTVKTMP